MSTATPPAATPSETARPAPVIRRLGGAGASSADRLLTRHLPAWVASGVLNFGLIALAWLVFGFQPAPAQSAGKVISASVERDPEDAVKDLENEDIGFQSPLASALPDVERVDAQTVEEAVTNDPIGLPTATAQDPNAMAMPGLPSLDAAGGAAGQTGDVLAGVGGANGNVVASLLGRSGATKSRLLKEGGGNDESERAVARGLAWLAAQQKKDGHWEFDPADKKHAERKLDHTTATGLALLPFLAAGATHKNPTSKYAKKVDAGLRYLVDHLDKSTGRFDSPSRQYMYGHGIATMALCEAYGMTKDPALRTAAQAAAGFIIKGQAANGSWGYQPGAAGDTSIVGWQVQALRAAQLSKGDLPFSDATRTRAMKFLDDVASGSSRAVYGYTSKGGAPGTSLTAVGLLCRYYMDGWGPNNRGMVEGVVGLFGTPRPAAGKDEPRTNRERAPKTRAEVEKNKTVPDMYYYYYATQVVHFFEGPEWQEWNEGPKDKDGKRQGGMRDWLTEVQKKAGADLGSWDPDAGSIGQNCGRLGTTCLCLLTLEVYYRHLPLYKRDTGAQLADAVR